MTNLEALSSITPFSANSQLLSKLLLDNSYVESDDYSISNKDDFDYLSALACKKIIANPDFSEGGMSVTYDRAKLIAYANEIFDNLDKSDEKIKTNRIKFI